jgi:predicted Zn finger-like uncharacterized protein
VQATCPQCNNRLLIDDAKVPDRPFSIKCPKCGNVLKLPGRAPDTSATMPGTPSAPPAVVHTPQPFAPVTTSEEMKAQVMAQIRREMGSGDAAGGRALVALPDKGLAGTLTLVLNRQGYAVDTIEDTEEGARLLEQGVYDFVATARIAGQPGKGESLYQRINRLNPDARRRLFLVLVGDEFKTGDGTQAWVVLADLVLNSRDAGSADAVLRSTLGERQRLYQTFSDVKRRAEASPSS